VVEEKLQKTDQVAVSAGQIFALAGRLFLICCRDMEFLDTVK
jgi:hypothetical protein